MNKTEIMEVLSEKSFPDTCIYCKGKVLRGYYAEDDLGRKLIFPKYLIRDFMDVDKEILIHFRCLTPFIFDLIREGESGIDGTTENTRVIIRY